MFREQLFFLTKEGVCKLKRLWRKIVKSLTYIIASNFFRSLVISILLILITYFYSNTPLSNNEVDNTVTFIREYISSLLSDDEDQSKTYKNEVVFINVSNDKELVDIFDERSVPKGEIDITHRGKLAEFFRRIENNHKFILCNVFFNPTYKSPNDSALLDGIQNTSRLMASGFFDGEQLIKPLFTENSAVSSFKASLSTNRFMKYTYLQQDTLKSIPLKMYNLIDRGDVSKTAWFYTTENNELCFNSVILDFRIKPIQRYDIASGDKNFFELGKDILDPVMGMSNEELEILTKDKIVLIGDYEDRDLHRIQYGAISGVLINYNAYLALKKGDHILPLSLLITLLVFYLGFVLFILTRSKKYPSFILNFGHEKFARIAISDRLKLIFTIFKGLFRILLLLTGVSIFLLILSSITYLIYKVHFDLVPVVIVYTILIEIKRLSNHKTSISK